MVQPLFTPWSIGKYLMSPDLQAGLIAGLIAAIPYLVMIVRGLAGLVREPTSREALGVWQLTGAALGTLAAAVTITHLLFLLLRNTGLTRDPSGWRWGLMLAIPVLLSGWIAFLGTLRDLRQHHFGSLLAGVFLGILGICGLPLGLVVLLAGFLFGQGPLFPSG